MPISTHPLGRYDDAWPGASLVVPLNLDGPPAAGEYVLAHVVLDYGDDQGVTLDGYTLLGSNGATRNAFAPWQYLFARRALADEPGSVTVQRTVTTAAKDTSVIVLGSAGVDTTTPLAAGPTFALTGRGSGTAPSVTPAVAATRALWFLAHQNYREAADSDVTWPAGLELVDAPSSFVVGSAAGEDIAAAAATGTRAWSIAPYGGNTDSTSVGLALRPSSASTTPPTNAGRGMLAY